ncbi:hypothetical protein [Streptomyces sp. VRA16 Mangrove soil]|uniref:hypothetical protein n=1 Tax=Streptomyces sp. VRA16 Mangrove soil TaxID=2817434 RepID=UPI001A9F0093|nr:hypothetical protein [Streptomyces sp. VRA16 Mangrove soil]MBO1331911.1 hypothetical protein [Streptomyces sp. VRA16 Mangrove soil]
MDTTTPRTTPRTARLTAALDRIGEVFGGMTASPDETGCTFCYAPEDIALLRQPDVPLPEDLLRSFFHEVPDHFDDHAAVLRRLLPQFTRWLADGSEAGSLGYGPCGLGRTRWPETWPRLQADAVREFIDAWWDDLLSAGPDARYDIDDAFSYAACMGGTITPLLERWSRDPLGGPADRALASACAHWDTDLLEDDYGLSVFLWWQWFDRPEPVAEFQTWLVEHAPARLRAGGADEDLITRIGLLALPYDARWADPHWESAAATN